MKKVKLLLEPAEVEMIRDALQLCYDENDLDDEDMLEGLCKAFGILAMNGDFVKVSVDENTHYADECRGDCDCGDGVNEDVVSDEDVDLDDCQCDECRADRGLPPLEGRCDGDPENDEASQFWSVDGTDEAWDTDSDGDDDGFCNDCGCSFCVCEDDDPDHVGCGVTKQDLEKAWNANEPWNTEKK